MTDWIDSANCATVGVDFMYPEPGEARAVRVAQEICDNCHVREECLSAAMAEEAGKSHYNRYGIRGALTPRQRASLAEQSSTESGVAA